MPRDDVTPLGISRHEVEWLNARAVAAALAEIVVRDYVSRLWAEDWDSPEDAVYDDGHQPRRPTTAGPVVAGSEPLTGGSEPPA